jgi:peptidoglycan/xylan/chitin deacetylase (PgdA/CDA1 family)
MNPAIRLLKTVAIVLLFLSPPVRALEVVPDKLVVLTFDDSVASHHSVVRPILKRHGFGATFFITEGFSFPTNKVDYMTWEQIAELHRDGFEIGNHTRDHMGVTEATLGKLRDQIEAINTRCAAHGIPKPVSFGYPGNAITPGAIPILRELGFRFARRGGAPEQPYEWGRGTAYEPGTDHPLLIPSAGDARPDWTLEDFKRAVDQARGGRIAVLQFHGVPDRDHPWVHTRPERFREFMEYLGTNQFKVVALRDLSRYVDPEKQPADPLAVIAKRRRERVETLVEGEVVDAATGQPLPARVYIQGSDGTWHFPKSTSLSGSAIRYERRNGGNTNAAEMHTTLSAHPFRVELTPGRYTISVGRGKEYFPEVREVEIKPGVNEKWRFALRRWVNMAESGWYSGDVHVHRHPDELPNVMLAEDLNVALPLTDWTTVSTLPPAAAERSLGGALGNGPVRVDATHVWFPRNTEYEIFTTGGKSHTLGALFILNHRTRFAQPVAPLENIAAQARREGALLDLDKHNWPWSMALVPLLKVDLFELANNHHWQTGYAIRNYALPAPAWMGFAGTGTDNERDWTLFGFQTYYALLDCGFRLRPSAGSASGVHPVPLGFGRVYVHLDGPFSYEAWMRGLSEGRSFVTTGPMISARVNGEWPGRTFTATTTSDFRAECTVTSEQPLESIELVVNGRVIRRFDPDNTATGTGAFRSEITTGFKPEHGSWLAWRCFEKRPGGRFRFAHTAPWHFEIAGKPLPPRRVEVEWLASLVKKEIERSRGIAPDSLIAEYERSLAAYERLLPDAR